MLLTVAIDGSLYRIEVTDTLLEEAEDFFSDIDRNLNRGRQMSRRWVECPNTLQRCQIAADRILTAILQENHSLAELAAAYILKRMPQVTRVDIDTSGNISQTTFTAD